MLQTRKLGKNSDVVAVSFTPLELSLRKSGRENFGSEETVCRIVENELIVDQGVAEKYGLTVSVEGAKPCQYCSGSTGPEAVIAWDMCNDGIVIESDGKVHMLCGGDWECQINYCPMCGRKFASKEETV